jgi:MscS family membrane protein
MAIGVSGFLPNKLMHRVCLVSALFCAPVWAQLKGSASEPSATRPQTVNDALGRSTPRGTVLGFLAAARKGRMEVAAQFLNTRLRGAAADSLAQQLFTVLDRRLPPRLQELSDSPEGSQADLKIRPRRGGYHIQR